MNHIIFGEAFYFGGREGGQKTLDEAVQSERVLHLVKPSAP